MNYGFIKVAAAIPQVKVADCIFNANQITGMIKDAASKDVQLIAFPELCITGYTCADLFQQQILIEEAENALQHIINETGDLNITSVVGMPVAVGASLINAAVVIRSKVIMGIIPKTYIPNYKEFYEKRWFTSATDITEEGTTLCSQWTDINPKLLFNLSNTKFGIEICEDLWAPIPPSSILATQGAEIIINISASNELIGKHKYLQSLLAQQSARCITGYIYSSAGFGESTTDVVFAGNAMIYENGSLLAEAKRFYLEPQLVISEIDVERLRSERRVNTSFATCASIFREEKGDETDTAATPPKEFTLTRTVEPLPFVPFGDALNERCEEIFEIQVSGLAKRLMHTHAQTAVVGISGGLDSTLALLVCVKTFDKLGLDRKGILGITMPGFGTTDRTYHNAIELMKSLGVSIREISIKDACIGHFKDIEHNIDVHDVTYENSQARERTQILMDVANQTNGMVIGTGDLSELALGWATYNGDHMSMYGVNGSIPKTLVKYLVEWVARHGVDEQSRITLLDIVDTPISPELIPADANGNIKQKTEDLVGPYELHDFFLYYFLRFGFRPAKIYFLARHAFTGKYDNETIKKWLSTFFRRFFNQQFKRSCLPDGPKVGSVSLSPRGDWRMPSDACSTLWLKEIEKL